MAKHIYNARLSERSINALIKKIDTYKKQLDRKNKEFIQRLSDLGVNVALMTLASKGSGDASRAAKFKVTFNVEDKTVEGIIAITSMPNRTSDGRVFYPHLAWEFGAGNYFNGAASPNPKAAEMGMGIGTFPGQTHVPDPGYWYYIDENGDKVRSYGTQATMPMYNASLEMIRQIETVAREVFV